MTRDDPPSRARVLSPLDRYSEILFGLIMALSFTCALSVAETGQAEVRTMLVAALALNRHSPNYVGTIGYLLVGAGEFECGEALVRQAIAWNPCHPKWFHHALCAFHYQRGDYERAWAEAAQVGFQVGFWDSAIKAAVLGKLGRISEAEAAGGELLAKIPDFDRRARDIASRTMKSADLVDDFLDGLRKAGLRIDG